MYSPNITPFSALPTSGSASYSILAATSAVNTISGASGSLTGSATVNFGSQPTISLSLTATLPSETYTIATRAAQNISSVTSSTSAGNYFDIASSALNTTGSGASAICTTSCQGAVKGSLVGSDGSKIGLAYSVSSGASNIVGAAILKK
jgi:hypothetical protein